VDQTKNRSRRPWAVFAVVACITIATIAHAQEGPPPPAPAAPENAAAAAAAAQLAPLLGGAEFMLIVERPFEAEKLFNAVLAQDPSNAHAQDGLRRVALAKRVNWTFLTHGYNNNLDASLITYGGGPTFYNSHGKVTFWVGDGFFKNDINGDNPDNPLSFLAPILGTADDEALRKQTVSMIWEPYYKQFDGYVYLNRTFYQEAPDRTLWNLRGTWNRRAGRETYSIFAGQHDSYLQSDLAQFFAPESFTAVVNKLLSREVGASAQIPIGKKIDVNPGFSYLDYTDGNARRIWRAQAMYRILPKGDNPLPIFRVGIAYLWDDANQPSLSYYAPIDFQSVSIAADYVYVTGKYRFGVFGTAPLTKTSGTGFGRFDPYWTLFSFVNYKLSPSREVWVKFTGVHSANLSPKLVDIVAGINLRF